jgi:guanylate kinase
MVQALVEHDPRLRVAVSATTRTRRPGEADGVHYWFLTRADFDRRIAEGEFLEWVDYVGNRYGTLRSEIDRIRREGLVPVLELELDGALAVKDAVPNAVTIFIDAPIDELERRLRERATESAGEIEDRIALARRQKELAGGFDHVVLNDRRERAAAECADIVEHELSDAATMARP